MMEKPLVWLGDSKRQVRAFPKDARSEAGLQLYAVQLGMAPNDWKSMKTIGKGVSEIRIRVEEGAFRVIYTATLGSEVYVLHAFPKKANKTNQQDIRLARSRYKALLGRLRSQHE
jgi:phage-related protein